MALLLLDNVLISKPAPSPVISCPLQSRFMLLTLVKDM